LRFGVSKDQCSTTEAFMAGIAKLVVGIWLAGVFASGSALAAVFDLGQLTPGPAGGFAAVGASVTPGVPFDDRYAFDVVGSNGLLGGSFVSSRMLPDGTGGFFDLNVQLFKWDSATSDFVALSGFAPGAVPFFDTGIPVAAAQGGDTSPGGINRAYYLKVFGTSDVIAPGQVDGYGGSIVIAAAVPEPSTTLFLLGGVLLAAMIGRRRLTGK